MHENAKFVCFIYMQPQKVKFKSVQINMKHVSYIVYKGSLKRIISAGIWRIYVLILLKQQII